jgi:CRISPR/Cas system-associated exonuclease Cas4 (RecB family)
MIFKIGEINFKEIKRISPSQFFSMKNCAYKSILAEAFDKKPLLPLSANAYFGTVLHSILELISKGIIKNEDELNIEFDEKVKNLEISLQNNGYGFLVPLKLNLRNFGLKKILLKKHLRIISQQTLFFGRTKYYSEKWFESQDKMIGGKVDLVIENESQIEILDFKTGAITDDYLDDKGEIYSDVKNEYKEQLKLYAYLYFESTNKLPTILSLVDLAKQKFSVEFSEFECKMLFEEAKNLLMLTNSCIRKMSFSANPNKENCGYCLYRPACSFYNTRLEIDFSFQDIIGEIEDVKKFLNGKVSLIVKLGTKHITIRNFKSNDFDTLYNYMNKRLKFYNLKIEVKESIYSVSNTTMIYE